MDNFLKQAIKATENDAKARQKDKNKNLGDLMGVHKSSGNIKKGYTMKKVRGTRRNGLHSTTQTLQPKDFFTREDFVAGQKENIPQGSESMLVVPPMFDGWGFLVDFFNPVFCEGIQEDVYKDTLRQVNKVIQQTLCRNRANEAKNHTSFHNILLFTGLFVLLAGFVSLMMGVLRSEASNMLCYMGIALFAVVLLVALGLYFSIFFFRQEEDLKETELYNKISKLLEDWNANYYKGRGFQWRTKARFMWLELHKIRRADGQVFDASPRLQIPSQMPQNH
jgi:hypothetical protein